MARPLPLQNNNPVLGINDLPLRTQLRGFESIGDIIQQIQLFCNIGVVLCCAKTQIGIAELQQGLSRLDETTLLYKHFLHSAAIHGV